jgi:hypothetical protein
MPRLASLFALVLAVAGCGLLTETDPPPAPVRDSARYLVTFESTWSAQTHPEAFPTDAHFSRLTGAVHAPGVSFWEVGLIASEGIRAMAEGGATAPLRAEVEAYGARADFVEGNPIPTSPGTASVEVSVSEERPLVTVVTMLAPSPDWFVGVSGLDLRRGDADWADVIFYDLQVQDAGTDDGASYTAADAPRAVWAPIGPVAYPPLGATTVGRITFTRVE